MSGFPIRREILVRFPAAGWGEGRERSYYLLGSFCVPGTLLFSPGLVTLLPDPSSSF